MSTTIRPGISKRNTYYISEHRYYELKHFCLQYPEWKKDYISLDGLSARPVDVNANRRSGEVSDPTPIYAEARLYFRNRMAMVERTAEEAAGDMSAMMLKAVTEGLSYNVISPPCCKEVWYTAYRRFFWLLDKARK